MLFRWPRSRSTAAVALVFAASFGVACSSDDSDDEVPVENEDGVPVDVDVPEGVDTEVEQQGNLGFDDEQPTIDD